MKRKLTVSGGSIFLKNKRLGHPEKICVTFLVAPESDYLKGKDKDFDINVLFTAFATLTSVDMFIRRYPGEKFFRLEVAITRHPSCDTEYMTLYEAQQQFPEVFMYSRDKDWLMQEGFCVVKP